MTIIREQDAEEILHCAFRYALGRSTYVTCTMADAIIHAWPSLSARMRNVILREIQDADDRNQIGMDMDRRQWMRVVERANTGQCQREGK